MTFDKEQYWKNRKAGKPGQGQYEPKLKVIKEASVNISFDNNEPVVVTREMKRRKRVDRDYTGKNYKKRITRKTNPFNGHNKIDENDPMLTWAQFTTNNKNLKPKDLRKMKFNSIGDK
jgi:hypothetical protein